MSGFLGEYECSLDSKGRVKMPSALLKQLAPENQVKFVVNRGFEQHLALYPIDEWNKKTEEIDKLNPYNRKTREFRRYFYRGATELVPDSSFRLLLPKSLMEWAKIGKDIILSAHSNMIEIWDKKCYENLLNDEPDHFAELAESVLGTKNENLDEK